MDICIQNPGDNSKRQFCRVCEKPVQPDNSLTSNGAGWNYYRWVKYFLCSHSYNVFISLSNPVLCKVCKQDLQLKISKRQEFNQYNQKIFIFCSISVHKLTSERLIRFNVVAPYQSIASVRLRYTIQPDQSAMQIIVKVISVSTERNTSGAPRNFPTCARTELNLIT